MKKLLFIMMCVAVVAFLSACPAPTELRWHNVSTETATDIRWVDYNGNEDDVQWNETVTDQDYSDFKEVQATNGYGECSLNGGLAAQIDVDNDGGADNLTLNEGNSETYNIYTVAK